MDNTNVGAARSAATIIAVSPRPILMPSEDISDLAPCFGETEAGIVMNAKLDATLPAARLIISSM